MIIVLEVLTDKPPTNGKDERNVKAIAHGLPQLQFLDLLRAVEMTTFVNWEL